MSQWMLFLIELFTLYNVLAISYENKYGPKYGKEWVLFAGEDGSIHYVDTKSTPAEFNCHGCSDRVSFYLYTRKNPSVPEQLMLKVPIKSTYYNSAKKTKILTHGWLTNGTSPSTMLIKDAYIKHTDHNVIVVDWSETGNNLIYKWAAYKTRSVGEKVATFINNLLNTYKLSVKKIHLIGHSLGAHVMSRAAKYTKKRICRITGLDPAGPLFELFYYTTHGLNKNDADFVDIIHTCGGILGYLNPYGHADFYPNGGVPQQPGCEGLQAAMEACSHGRAYEFFAESIGATKNEFVACPAKNWDAFKKSRISGKKVVMGEHVNKAAMGSYYLYTNSKPDFAMGDSGKGKKIKGRT